MNSGIGNTVELSIVIPAFNEAQKIAADIAAGSAFLSSGSLSGEIIIVDDGSSDNTAQTAKQAVKLSSAAVRVIRLDRHRGKGCAVRTGILASRGNYVLFADSGGCVPFDCALDGIRLIQDEHCHIAHGSRTLNSSQVRQKQSLYRRICSQLFRKLLIKNLRQHTHLTDTQCGFKVYRGDIARLLYTSSTIDGFIFDIEIILLAAQNGFTIWEFPIHWSCDPDSRFQPAHQVLAILWDWIRLKYRYPRW